MEKGRVIFCNQCDKQLEVRWAIFAHQTLQRHLKEHNSGKKTA